MSALQAETRLSHLKGKATKHFTEEFPREFSL